MSNVLGALRQAPVSLDMSVALYHVIAEIRYPAAYRRAAVQARGGFEED